MNLSALRTISKNPASYGASISDGSAKVITQKLHFFPLRNIGI